MGEQIKFPTKVLVTPTKGSAGLPTHIPGATTTVSNVAVTSGGIKPGGIIERDI